MTDIWREQIQRELQMSPDFSGPEVHGGSCHQFQLYSVVLKYLK